MPGLANSRWAAPRSSSVPTAAPSSALSPTTAAGATASSAHANGSRPPSSAAELMRYAKIVRRLKWKLPYLAHGYRQATLRGADADADADAVHGRTEAELMFKLDFFEYYMLLERALVHLLGVFGIAISRDFAERHLRMMLEEQRQQDIARYGGGGGGSRRREASPWKNTSSHRYHANVLEALDNAENPLHEALGTGEVRRQLGRAKDLRNRWKNVDDVEDATANGIGNGNGNGNNFQTAKAKTATPLESYDLERILETIFEGFDKAFAVAERHVLEEQQAAANGGSAVAMDWGSEEQQWEFMVDAMDWEAV